VTTNGLVPAAVLRARLATPGILLLPGVADALVARIAADRGFEAVYATGAGIANALLGVPDLGLTTMTEAADQVARIVDAVEIPVVADIDTGFGNAINARRAMRAFERAGAAAVQIEDQVFPKRCGHFEGKAVIPVGEMVAKLHALTDARHDPSVVVIARTDALAGEGLEAAVERAAAYRAAGADILFVEAPTDRQTLLSLPGRIDAPLLANMVEGGKTPLLSAAELDAAGYRIALFANTALRVAAAAVRSALDELRTTGDAGPLQDRMLSWADRQALVDLPGYQRLEQRYRDPADDPGGVDSP
jgi:2-methylisocitrate lyase-like PEP mutase family enzyme